MALPVLDNQNMGQLDEIGDRDGWICWLCDQPVGREMPSNDPRGPSVDTRITKAKAKKLKKTKTPPPLQRLAHVGCNTGKGAIDAVVPWPSHLIVSEPAAIIGTSQRLERRPRSHGPLSLAGKCRWARKKVSSTNGINISLSHCAASSFLSWLLGFVIKV